MATSLSCYSNNYIKVATGQEMLRKKNSLKSGNFHIDILT